MKTKIVLHSIVLHAEIIYRSFPVLMPGSNIEVFLMTIYCKIALIKIDCHQQSNYWSNLSSTKPRYPLWIAENFALLIILIWYIVIHLGVGVQKCRNSIQFTEKWLENYSCCLFQVSCRRNYFLRWSFRNVETFSNISYKCALQCTLERIAICKCTVPVKSTITIFHCVEMPLGSAMQDMSAL